MTENHAEAGDIVEWMGAPVLVIGPVSRTTLNHPSQTHSAPAAYLRQPDRVSSVTVGTVLEFNVTYKPLWTEPLTDEEEALAFRLMLIGE